MPFFIRNPPAWAILEFEISFDRSRCPHYSSHIEDLTSGLEDSGRVDQAIILQGRGRIAVALIQQKASQIDVLIAPSEDDGPGVRKRVPADRCVPAGLSGGLEDVRDLRRQVLDQDPEVNIAVPGDEAAVPDDAKEGSQDEEEWDIEPIQDLGNLEEGGIGFGHFGLSIVI